MKDFKASFAIVAALCLVSTAVPASADPLKNIVLVHGAWVDAAGWKPVYDILRKDGFNITMVQEPETSFPDDVAETKRVLDLQDGPTLLVGHSYGGSIITEAGIHPNVVGLVYVAAHAPDVGEDEAALGKKRQASWQDRRRHQGKRRTRFTYLDPAVFPKLFAPDLRAGGGIYGRLSGAGGGQGFQHTADSGGVEDEAELGDRRRGRQDHQSRSRALVLRPGQESDDGNQGRQPLGVPIPSERGCGRDRRRRPQRSKRAERAKIDLPPKAVSPPKLWN
jgi:pimeloyl-ACP methyl ester carboxylesterase